MDQVSKKSEKEKFRQAHNHAAMVETMMSVRDMMRDPLPDNPPPDDKWKAAIGLARVVADVESLNRPHLTEAAVRTWSEQPNWHRSLSGVVA